MIQPTPSPLPLREGSGEGWPQLRDLPSEALSPLVCASPPLPPPPSSRGGGEDVLVGRFTVAHDHPSLPGHFPGRPIVPGVVLLDEVLACLPGTTLFSAKFVAPVEPGMEVEIQRRTAPNGRTSFVCVSGGRIVLQGTVTTAPQETVA